MSLFEYPKPPRFIAIRIYIIYLTIALPCSLQSSQPEIYAGGDIVRGGATVILAMGDGRRAAENMAKQLSGK